MARYASERDFSFVKESWRTCFDDPDSFVEWNFSRNYHAENTVIAEFEGAPASNMQLMPYEIRLCQKNYSANYVSGVATLPQFRNHGLVRELFAFAFPEMLKRGEAVSILVPFNYAFYEKFGYTQCYHRMIKTTKKLPEGRIFSADSLNESLIKRLNSIYLRDMQDKNGFVLRTENDLRLILEDLLINSKGGAVILGNAEEPSGYALFTNEGREYTLHEACGFCPIPMKCRKEPFAMARIINVPLILKDIAETFDGSIKLKITDPDIPSNNLTVHLKNHTIFPCSEFDFEVDIKTFTSTVFGFGDDFTGTGLFQKQKNYINLLL